MNILLTIHHHLDPNAGAPGSILNLGQAYQALGHSVEYYSFDQLPNWLPDLATTMIFPEFVAAHLATVVKQRHIDVIDASTGDAWIWGKWLRSRSTRSPLLVTHCHGLEHVAHLQYLEEVQRHNLKLSWKYPIYHGGFRLWEVATSLQYADLVLMLNQRDANFTSKTFGIPTQSIRLIPNGIPEAFLGLPAPTLEQSQADIKIALVGTYIPRKGIRYSVPALNAILTRHAEVTVTWLGTGCPAEAILADFVPEHHDRVHVISSYAHDDLPTLLKNHQILLFPSLSEGFPLAVPEAMACGLVPVVTDIPGPTEIVEHQQNGVLLSVRDSQAIEEALEFLMSDRAYLQHLRHQAHATAQHYSWLTVAQKRLSIYEQAWSERNSLGHCVQSNTSIVKHTDSTTMKRLHIAASRFEKLLPHTITQIADPTWVHLGEPAIHWTTRLKTELQNGQLLHGSRTLYRVLKPIHSSKQLEAFYANTDFREFYYKVGDHLEFDENTFDFIYSEHFFEHLFLDEAVELLKECYRLLKPEGVIRIVVPDADLRTYEKPEPLGFPSHKIAWTDPDKHKTRWSIHSLPLVIQVAGLRSRPVMYTDAFGKFFNLVPSDADQEYQHSADKQFIYSVDYIRRLPSLICDGIKSS